MVGHVTIRLLGVDFLWVVHSDHVYLEIWCHNGGRIDLDTERKMEEGKEKERGEGKEKENGKEKGKKKGKGER